MIQDNPKSRCRLAGAVLWGGMLLCPVLATAQPFLVPNDGDLLAGFRKTGANQANYEVVVNVGNITNFEALASGTQTTVTRFSASQLSDAFADLNNLQWSVSGTLKVFGSWAGFPNATFWFTLPRATSGTQSVAPGRFSSAVQKQVKQEMLGVGIGAAFISSSGVSNADNTAFLVREPSGDSQHALSVYLADPNFSEIGDFNANLPFDVENNTPANFTSAVRSDLYQSCPTGTTDPLTHTTTGQAYYVGYFELSPDGTLSFTRASAGTQTNSPPTPPELTLARAGSTTTISLATTNGATYTLYHTNSAGLTAPISTWATLPGTLTGDGTIESFTDSSTDADRVYRVGAQ